MKKQFLSLIVALLASISFAWGQNDGAYHNSTGMTTTCTTDPLHPAAGVPYVYKAAGTPAGGTYRWWATKDPNFITAPGVTNMGTALTVSSTQLIAVSPNYASTSSTVDEVTITWSDDILSHTKYQAVPGADPSPTFVAVHYVSGSADCSDNFKVFELDPKNMFMVDIKNIVDNTKAILDYGITTEQCPSGVASATYSGGSMHYNFGVDTMYYEVVASNFTNYWIPTYTVTGTASAQVVETQFTYDPPSSWNASTNWQPIVSGTTHFAVGSTVTTTQNGVSVYVRNIIRNNTYEGLTQRTITMIVDGQNSVGKWDVVNATCVDPNAADQNDQAGQNLRPRPTVLPVAPSTPFVTGDETQN